MSCIFISYKRADKDKVLKNMNQMSPLEKVPFFRKKLFKRLSIFEESLIINAFNNFRSVDNFGFGLFQVDSSDRVINFDY